jgi:hypothetical protein
LINNPRGSTYLLASSFDHDKIPPDAVRLANPFPVAYQPEPDTSMHLQDSVIFEKDIRLERPYIVHFAAVDEGFQEAFAGFLPGIARGDINIDFGNAGIDAAGGNRRECGPADDPVPSMATSRLCER